VAPHTSETTVRPAATPAAGVSADLERSLTQVGRAILRLEVPTDALPDGVHINKTGHWLLVRVFESAPVRLSEIADSSELDLSTISRQVRDLVTAGLLAKVPDPADGRAALLSITGQGIEVLESVSEARRRVLAEAIADWSDEDRNSLAIGLLRLGAGLQHARDYDERI